jgi:FkbM family methyltransferase
MGIIRKLSLKLLKATAFNTSIKHHFTNKNFLLNTYNHKGYWYYGKKREEETINVFQKWIEKDNYVLEIGGHIGYFTTFYADLVGTKGKVDVFEPSDANLFYLNKNIANLPKGLSAITTVVTKGAGDVNETLNFYIDPISGQNNSFVENFDGFINSRELSADKSVEIIISKVDVITLDSYYETATRFPDFVKIDVEGFEWNVLQGFKNTIIKHHPKLMVEIQSDADTIIKFFKENGYTIYNDRLEEIVDYKEYLNKKTANIFFSYNK